MGNSAFCGNCSEMCREQFEEVRCDQPEKQRIYAVRKLFELLDFDNDGRITVDDFVLMGLHQTKLHAERRMNRQEEESIKDAFVQKFFKEIDSKFQPVPYYKYKHYLLRTVEQIHPGDMQASGCQNGVFFSMVILSSGMAGMEEQAN